MTRYYHRRTNGMTLIEAVVWVCIYAFVMVALLSSLLYFYRTNRYVIQEALAVSTTQRVIDTTIRTIRSATYSQVGAYPIVSIAPNQVMFYVSAVPGSTTIDMVRFFVTGTKLEEGITPPTGTPYTYNTSNESITFMVNYIQNGMMGTSTFHYFDVNGNEITNYASIQSVRYITLNAYIDVSTSTSPNPLLLSSSAALRNVINSQQ